MRRFLWVPGDRKLVRLFLFFGRYMYIHVESISPGETEAVNLERYGETEAVNGSLSFDMERPRLIKINLIIHFRVRVTTLKGKKRPSYW